ncbi:hypothetical protein M4L39_02605 [Staphylococcus equorum]|uniref:DeoR-like transcriptional repressor C-terminal sensor domain-containing protein n=1 Tax=Staphylococcus equorum TaxID=246432 RepID=A0A9X4R074_9STAP|nr:hypothetical protein [Staphylococcus equorum]MDG0842315.1 hypothetical protein [Staphylococcus equorum]MDG0858552.1 hypothetical protein [Staphylococcus equorum]
MSSIKNYLEQIIEEINENEIIAFDNHPTAYKIIDQLFYKGIKISVISYSTDIIKYVAKHTNFNIILSNGVVSSEYHIIVGADVAQTFSKYRISRYFATMPYMADSSLYQTIPEVAEIQIVLKQSADQFLLINRPEFLNTALVPEFIHIGDF